MDFPRKTHSVNDTQDVEREQESWDRARVHVNILGVACKSQGQGKSHRPYTVLSAILILIHCVSHVCVSHVCGSSTWVTYVSNVIGG